MTTTPHVLSTGSFSQDWTNAGLITINDDWSGVASIMGYRGDGQPTTAGVDPATVTASVASPVIDVNANQTAPNSFSTGGVTEFAVTDPTIALAGSSTGRSPNLVIHLDASGRENIVVSYRVRDLENGTDNAIQPVALQYRTSTSAIWTSVPAGYVADATSGPSIFGADILVSASLPSDANNASTLEVRILTTDAAGNDEWVGIDDIVVSSSAATSTATGEFAITAAVASVSEPDIGTTSVIFNISRANGSTGAASVNYTLSGITLDDLSSGALTGSVAFADGATSGTITVAVHGDYTIEPNEVLTATLTGSTSGTSITTSAASTTINNNDLPGTISITDITVAEGAGNAVLTVARTSGLGAITITVGAASGTATLGTDFTVPAGTLNIAGGATSGTITVPITQDLAIEGSEAFTVTIGAGTSGATLGQSTATVTITDDDTLPALSISDPTVTEGANGTVILTFTVTPSVAAPAGGITFDIATADGTATAGSDYVARTITGASIAAGTSTPYQFSVTVNGDTVFEPNETVLVNITNVINAVNPDGQGVGTITNDDVSPIARLIDESFTGFTAAGFAPVPAAGQLDSDIWRVAGLSDNPTPAYGFTGPAGGDFGRGVIVTNETTAGVFSPTGNGALVVQASGSEFEANGFIEARIQNNSNAIVSDLAVDFDWAYRNNADRGEQMTFGWSTDGVNFTTVPAAAFTTPVAMGNPVPTTFSMQAATANISGLNLGVDAYVYLRWTHVQSSGSGNRDEVGIDNLIVDATTTSTVSIGAASLSEGANGQALMTFTVSRTDVTSAFSVNYATSDGTANAGSDYVAGSGTLSFAAGGPASQTITVAVNGDTVPELGETFNVALSGLTNTTGTTGIGRATGIGTIVNDDGPPIEVSIAPTSVTEGNAGTTTMTFTVSRTGATDAFSINYATADQSATAGSDYVAASGTLSFGVGENSKTIAVTVNGDVDSEAIELVRVNLSGAAPGTVLTTATALGSILNDDITRIHDIQGSSYFSPMLAAAGVTTYNATSLSATVLVNAVVTAVDNVGTRQGFYITDASQNWDMNPSTSEGIFVMTRNDANVGNALSASLAANVAVGDLVTVTAQIMEYQYLSNLPRTVLTNVSNYTLNAQNQALPALVLDSTRPIPNAILTEVTPNLLDTNDDPGDTFDVGTRALSYFESLEGMLVTAPDMRVADGVVTSSGGRPYLQAYSAVHANPEQINSRGGYTIAGDPPFGPPDTGSTLDNTVRDGRHLFDGDVNPDVIEVDFTDFAVAPPANIGTLASAGDRLGDVTGIIDFDFTDRKLFVTQAVTFTDTTQVRETTTLVGSPTALTVATFNVENLDPTDPASKFTGLANAMAQNLKLPDILIIEEIQDSNGAAAGGVTVGGVTYGQTDASLTWQMLVDAINNTPEAVASGTIYQWVDEEPVYNAEGGEQSGNIRVGFLYNTARVQLGDLNANATIAERRQFTDRVGDGVRDAGDRLTYADDLVAGEINSADWTSTRKSLLGEFTFLGEKVYLVGNHFPSKGGSGEFYQLDLNIDAGSPTNAGWAKRVADAEDVWAMLNAISTGSPGAKVLAGGDFNDFYFYRPLQVATGYQNADGTARVGGTRYDNLILTLPEAERYTYNFDGRAQAIDHIIASTSLSSIAQYDVVHINTLLGSATTALSDHDPAVARFEFATVTPTPTPTPVPTDPNAPVTVGNTTYISADFVLPANDTTPIISTRAHAGTAPINLTGNANSQILIGNSGNNILNGYGGNDTLYGLGGNDVFLVRGQSDVVVEFAGDGFDIVYSTDDYNLGDGAIEALSTVDHSSTAPINLIGNYLSQSVIGNFGSNLLNGGSGVDTLIGLGGDDLYAIGDSRSIVVEADGGGTDTLVVSVDYSLGAGVSIEVLAAQDRAGSAALRLRGNELAQTVAGTEGANTIDGGGGNDMLIGGGGADLFAFSTALGAGNVDALADFQPGADRIGLAGDVFGGIGATLDSSAFIAGPSATTAAQRIVFDQATGRIFYDADGSGAGAAILFALVTPGAALTAANFEMISPVAMIA